jgi:uncharacterized protein (DUF433 family)
MTKEIIHNRGRGPEIVGTRITVYNLMPYFLDPSITESYIAQIYDLSVEQIAAARAYALNNADSVLATHTQIEARMAEGNPPEVIEQAKRTHARFMQFREWLATQRKSDEREAGVASESTNGRDRKESIPNFHDWLVARQTAEHS